MVWEIADAVRRMCTAHGRQRKAESAGSAVRRGDPACSSVSPRRRAAMPVVRHQDVNAWMTSLDVTTSAWRGKMRWVRKSWTSAS